MNWYALLTKVHQEFKAKAQLDALNIINYLPAVTRLKQWSDRKKRITEPVLKGYIFIRATEKERLIALEQPSVARCLFEKGKPAVIRDWQIENLRRVLETKFEVYVYDGLIPGREIEIISGPLKGIKGIIQSTPTEKHIAVCIKLLNRTVIAKIPPDVSIKLS